MSTEAAPEVQLGQWIDGYQVMSQAPVDFIQGTRRRLFGKHLVTGSWSDPWWLYDPERGWAIVKRWKNRDTEIHDWVGGRILVTPFPARNELIIESWEDPADVELPR
jgi:hypothetical protein